MKSKTLTRIGKMLKPEKKAIIIISILAIVINIGEVIRPYLIEIVIDDYLSLGIWQKGAVTIRNDWSFIYRNCYISAI